MPGRIPWVEKKFVFSFPVDCYPEVLERVRGVPVRLEEKIRTTPADVLRARINDRWSIQEHAGHLGDLEALFMGRLDDFTAGAETLRAADMTNRKTHGANHNEAPIENILATFRADRQAIVARAEAMAPEWFAKTALHPRLKVPMRMIDMFYFQAEHDDYHLARITELQRVLKELP